LYESVLCAVYVLTPCVNFINVLHARFLYERLFSSYVLALNKLSYKKRAHKTMMKLTQACVCNFFGERILAQKELVKQGRATIFTCGPFRALLCVSRARFKSNMTIQS
jgi:hypothetical protein